MSKLTYEELILLNNLIYLKWNIEENERLINVVDDLLENEEFDYLMDVVGDCIIKMTAREWIIILKQIKASSNLNELIMKNVESYNNGMKYACLVDKDENVTVVFRGTATIKEWEDNGKGAYEYETEEQIEALDYINKINYDNITVTGHSKGGNKAQYATIFSSKISKCISINGQGFSKEFINKYQENINKNRDKIISINAKYDYVYCLFNSIAGKNYYVKTKIQTNLLEYHKASILLDEEGHLREETNESKFSKIINYFSSDIISNLQDDLKHLVVDGIINVIEFILCRKKENDNIFKILGEHLIMFCHKNCFYYKELFNFGYIISEILMLPLLFWNDFIYIEENNSKELLKIVAAKIRTLGNQNIKKLEIIDKDQINLIQNISYSINKLIYEIENKI